MKRNIPMCSTLLCPPSLNSCTHKHFSCSNANPWAQCRHFSSVNITAVGLFGLFVGTAKNLSRPIMRLVDTLLLLYRHYLIFQLKIIQCAIEKWNSQGRHLTEPKPNLRLMLSCRYRHSLTKPNKTKPQPLLPLYHPLSYYCRTWVEISYTNFMSCKRATFGFFSFLSCWIHIQHDKNEKKRCPLATHKHRYICVHACMHAILTSRMVF